MEMNNDEPVEVKKYSALEYLSKHADCIRKILESEPFFAIVLTSCGIELMGKSISNCSSWSQDGQSEIDYNKVIVQCPAFKKYKAWKLEGFNLYDGLRCAPVHELSTIPQIVLMNKGDSYKDDTTNVLYVSATDYFDAFNKAVEDLRKDKKRGKKTVPPDSKSYIKVATEGDRSITGTGINDQWKFK